MHFVQSGGNMGFDKVKYDNDYAKNNYDRIPINVPKGKKELIKAYAQIKGYSSINAYVIALIDEDMNKNKSFNVASTKLDTKNLKG